MDSAKRTKTEAERIELSAKRKYIALFLTCFSRIYFDKTGTSSSAALHPFPEMRTTTFRLTVVLPPLSYFLFAMMFCTSCGVEAVVSCNVFVCYLPPKNLSITCATITLSDNTPRVTQVHWETILKRTGMCLVLEMAAPSQNEE